MLISQIKYLNYSNVTISGQSLLCINFGNDSKSDGTIISTTWSIPTIISGLPSAVSVVDNSVLIDDNEDVTFLLDMLTSDSDGFIASSRAKIIKLAGDVEFKAINVDAIILPNNLVYFLPIDNSEIIIGPGIIPVPAYLGYWFDRDNNGSWDVQDNSGVIPSFNYVYGTNPVYTARIGAPTIGTTNTVNSVVFSRVAFNPTITNPQDIVITTAADCTTMEVYSETADYLSVLLGRGGLDNSEMKYVEVTLTTNCCTTDNISCKLYPLYNLGLTQGEYEQVGILVEWPLACAPGVLYYVNEVPMTITGIDSSVISTLQYTNRGLPGYTTVTNTNQFTLEVMIEDPLAGCGGQVSQTNTVIITTVSGHIYTIVYTLSEPYVTQMTLTIDSITTPTPEELNPCGLTIVENPSNTTLELNASDFQIGEEGDPIPDGIYQITFNNSGLSNETVFGCTFVDCETYCLVIKALANECPVNISILYEALKYSSNCDNVSCQNLCDLYEMLIKSIDDCDCTILSNNQPVISPNCGCGNKTSKGGC